MFRRCVVTWCQRVATSLPAQSAAAEAMPYAPYSCNKRHIGGTYPATLSTASAMTARAQERGYRSEAWGTTKQIEELNGKVRQGEEGVGIPITTRQGQTSMFTWFNAEQLEDPSVFPSLHKNRGAAQTVIAASEALNGASPNRATQETNRSTQSAAKGTGSTNSVPQETNALATVIQTPACSFQRAKSRKNTRRAGVVTDASTKRATQESNRSIQSAAALPEVICPDTKTESIEGAPQALAAVNPVPAQKGPVIVLSQDQSNAVAIAMLGHHLYVAGKAGTGKSIVLREIVKRLKEQGKRVAVTGTTGIAACNVDGVTLQSIFGLNCDLRTPKLLHFDTIIVDEVSMLSAELFMNLHCAALAMTFADKPFGGIQIILCGDFLQLGVVDKEGTQNQLFRSPLFLKHFVQVKLSVNHRVNSKHGTFLEILNALREGHVPDDISDTITMLNKDDHMPPEMLHNATYIYAVNKKVYELNSIKVRELQGDAVIFPAEVKLVTQTKTAAAAPPPTDLIGRKAENVTLKVGARVMLTSNLTPKFVNGSLGVVTSFVSLQEAMGTWDKDILENMHAFHAFEVCLKTLPDQLYPKIQFDSGELFVVPPILWPIRNAEGEPLGTILYLPVMLAFALTIHKVQGMTLTGKVVVDFCSNVMKCHHLVYVALSRVRHPEQLIVRGLNEMRFRRNIRLRVEVTACPLALKFNRGIQDAATFDLNALKDDTNAAAAQLGAPFPPLVPLTKDELKFYADEERTFGRIERARRFVLPDEWGSQREQESRFDEEPEAEEPPQSNHPYIIGKTGNNKKECLYRGKIGHISRKCPRKQKDSSRKLPACLASRGHGHTSRIRNGEREGSSE